MDQFSCTLPTIEGNNGDYNRSFSSLASYPPIYIKQDGFMGAPQAFPSKSSLDRPILIMPQNESLPKRLTRIYYEDGAMEAIKEAERETQGHPINHILRGLCYGLTKLKEFNHFLWPYMNNQSVQNLGDFSQTRDWEHSTIRVMRWHPNVFKLAIASSDDNIRIYTTDTSGTTSLKNGYQKSVTSLAWRPFSAGELAVGCISGILIWKLEQAKRHNSQFTYLSSSNHCPINSVEWNGNGSLLVSVSVNDPNAIVWEVDSKRSVPLKRIGMPCALVQWSPNNQQLFTSTIGSVFRVWNTDKWTTERWTIPTGAVQSVAWSPCSNHVLFVTTDQPILYSLCFIEEQLYKVSAAPKQSFPIADFTPTLHGNRTIGGLPKSIVWDPSGRFVAVMFKSSASIAVFATSINRNLLSISPNFYINGDDIDEYPTYVCFKEIYNEHDDVILTVAWSTGRVQYVPIQ